MATWILIIVLGGQDYRMYSVSGFSSAQECAVAENQVRKSNENPWRASPVVFTSCLKQTKMLPGPAEKEK